MWWRRRKTLSPLGSTVGTDDDSGVSPLSPVGPPGSGEATGLKCRKTLTHHSRGSLFSSAGACPLNSSSYSVCRSTAVLQQALCTSPDSLLHHIPTGTEHCGWGPSITLDDMMSVSQAHNQAAVMKPLSSMSQ